MIPFFDFRPHLTQIRSEVDAAIERVLASGRLILGPELDAFEREFAAYIGVKTAVGVNSGTDAITLALRALGVGAGDEVITVANAGVPPVAAIRAAGATPRFVDVDAATLQLDPARLPEAMSPRTRCVLAVHLYGHPAPLGEIVEFVDRNGLHLVEDCAQAHGALYRGRPVGGFGAVGCFSFYPTKNLGALGDAGICVTSDAGLAERLRLGRMYGFRGRERRALIEGLNTRLDEIQAAVLRVKLRHLDGMVARRRELAARYAAGLGGSVLRLPGDGPECRHAYHLYVVRHDERPELQRRLDAAAVGHAVHYPHAVHRMPAYGFLGYEEGALPITEHACAAVLSLPLYPGLEDRDVDRVVQALVATS